MPTIQVAKRLMDAVLQSGNYETMTPEEFEFWLKKVKDQYAVYRTALGR